MWRLATLVCLTALVLGCAGASDRGVRAISVHRYVFGAFGGGHIDVREICASGRARRVELKRPLWAYLASVGSLGFYLPHEVVLECSER